MASIEVKQFGPDRFRLVVKTSEGHTYGLCTCLSGHKTPKEAEDCPRAQERARKYEK